MATTTLPAHVDAAQHFATKADLAKIEGILSYFATKADLAKIEGALPYFATKADLAQLETRLMRWFIGILVAIIVNAVGVIISIILAAL